jgi:hypothetical protein
VELEELRLSSSDAADAELQLSETTLHVVHEGLALWCQPDGATLPLEQDGAEISLEAPDSMADSARREA